MVNQFIHLKTKSHYSILESSIKLDDLISRAVEDNMPAIALTDTNNLFGAMEFTKKALEKKIKPILGATILVEYYEKSHNFKALYNITCLIKQKTLRPPIICFKVPRGPKFHDQKQYLVRYELTAQTYVL